ncbi:serine/threonine protein kinase [Pedobacter sp. AK017]|uniref:lanthionine synthetase LanC family protein n=1 Tax=Pedobacter sp. AK017 TaxID=2723073 RepID=UPI001620D07C|nr:lanthionine synthetase LanC family protein [Pedobacter sp. AK017]MBB5438559.1 serine/threonine protein kinase [Pedobacter sp. AK017]
MKNPDTFRSILVNHKLSFKNEGIFLLAGPPPSPNNRIIYISIVRSQIAEVLAILASLFAAEQITFKVIKNKMLAKQVLSGVFGEGHIGKVITIYLSGYVDQQEIIAQLIRLTSGYKGPAVPGRIHLGGLVYSSLPHKGMSATGQPSIANTRRFLNNKYMVTATLKQDVKGDVLKGLYFKGFMKLGKCVIKEGRYCMWSDDDGRDMKHRLEWQQHVHQDLAGVIQIPRIIALFEANQNSYLVMEFIKGETLTKVIDSIYKGRTWLQLSLNERNRLLNLLLQVVNALAKLHEKGYLHRDVTPENFLVSPTQELYLIDMEMAYSARQDYPSPAFGLGSPGYMSPQQELTQKPTVKEDIYGLAALMIVFLTNMPPKKFNLHNPVQTGVGIFFFTGDFPIAGTLVKCLNKAPYHRPSLSTIKSHIHSFITHQQHKADDRGAFEIAVFPEKAEVLNLISLALEGLTISELFKPKTGLAPGMAGILYLLYKTGPSGCGIRTLNFFSNYLKPHFDSILIQKKPAGLLEGATGQSLLLHYGISTGMCSCLSENLDKIKNSFYTISNQFDLANGIAGQALAALLICDTAPTDFLKERIGTYIKMLIQVQKDDGSWTVDSIAENAYNGLYGLTNGIPGIIVALIKCDGLLPDDQTKAAIQKGLDWLKRSMKNQSQLNVYPHIALSFLYAYEHSGNQTHRDMAEKLLWQCPGHAVSANYSLINGMAGVGFVYAEAARICKHPEWKKRAAWVYHVLSNTIHTKGKNKISWHMGTANPHDLSLLTGTPGIILFLLKFKELYNPTNQYTH